MDTVAPRLCLNVAGVHIEGECAKIAIVVAVDVSEKWSSGALLVTSRCVGDHARVHRGTTVCKAPDIIVNKSLAGVELGTRLAIDVEHV